MISSFPHPRPTLHPIAILDLPHHLFRCPVANGLAKTKQAMNKPAALFRILLKRQRLPQRHQFSPLLEHRP
jgi:hypothetical protein